MVHWDHWGVSNKDRARGRGGPLALRIWLPCDLGLVI